MDVDFTSFDQCSGDWRGAVKGILDVGKYENGSCSPMRWWQRRHSVFHHRPSLVAGWVLQPCICAGLLRKSVVVDVSFRRSMLYVLLQTWSEVNCFTYQIFILYGIGLIGIWIAFKDFQGRIFIGIYDNHVWHRLSSCCLCRSGGGKLVYDEWKAVWCVCPSLVFLFCPLPFAWTILHFSVHLVEMCEVWGKEIPIDFWWMQVLYCCFWWYQPIKAIMFSQMEPLFAITTHGVGLRRTVVTQSLSLFNPTFHHFNLIWMVDFWEDSFF